MDRKCPMCGLRCLDPVRGTRVRCRACGATVDLRATKRFDSWKTNQFEDLDRRPVDRYGVYNSFGRLVGCTCGRADCPWCGKVG
jgi:hypothetical protein